MFRMASRSIPPGVVEHIAQQRLEAQAKVSAQNRIDEDRKRAEYDRESAASGKCGILCMGGCGVCVIPGVLRTDGLFQFNGARCVIPNGLLDIQCIKCGKLSLCKIVNGYATNLPPDTPRPGTVREMQDYHRDPRPGAVRKMQEYHRDMPSLPPPSSTVSLPRLFLLLLKSARS